MEPQTQTVFTVTMSRIGLMSIQPHQALYEKNTIVSMNCIVEVRPNVPLKTLLANYGNKMYKIPNNQVVAHLLPQPSRVIPTTVNLAEVLVLRDHYYGDRDIQETQEVFSTVYKEDSNGPQYINESTPQEWVDHTNVSKMDPSAIST